MRPATATTARAVEMVALIVLIADATKRGPITSWESRHISPPRSWPPGARGLSAVGSTRTLLTASCMITLSGRATPRHVGAVALAAGARAALARRVARPRPPEAWWREQPHGFSFPSRHTTYAMLLFWLAPSALGREGRAEAWMVATGLLVGSARLRRGVHWPTDVLAAVLATDLWFRQASAWRGVVRRS